MWYKLTEKNILEFKHNDSYSPKLLREFVRNNRFDSYCKPYYNQDFKRLFETGKNKEDLSRGYPPCIDHAAAFKRKDGLTCLTFHTYAQPNEIGSKINDWAVSKGLVAEIHDSSHSWYWPKHTTLVIIRLPNDEVKL